MKALVLKDLPRVDELDQSASQSVRGGVACLTREPPSCPGEMMPPIVIRRGWDQCPPIHWGCGPVHLPYGKPPSHCEPVVVPL
ncbi:hypothetical protein B0G76_5446 [Paraburkholderia sp. BL23I1N1]|uniref:hypothetical protein n=1 Tax=Paraburkholderia sp. BL23I1N1 TaxID=1938802 RepID=UPI000E755738|nr:hypothetical protein [Paraburkholderia sp. BL23I1N1]RKE39060.1 hypothetical protein B0G76_5446 [Paraburkholderia sp. BL23I1N1]